MNQMVKVAAALAFSLPVVLGNSASALTAVDDPVYDIAGQGMVEVEEVSGHADGQIENE